MAVTFELVASLDSRGALHGGGDISFDVDESLKQGIIGRWQLDWDQIDNGNRV